MANYPTRRYTPRAGNQNDSWANAKPVAPRAMPAAVRRTPTIAAKPQGQAAAKAGLKVVGTPQLWVTLQRVSDPESGWIKTTRAMTVPGGVLINTCSRKEGTMTVAEALCLVPGAQLQQIDQKWRLTS